MLFKATFEQSKYLSQSLCTKVHRPYFLVSTSPLYTEQIFTLDWTLKSEALWIPSLHQTRSCQSEVEEDIRGRQAGNRERTRDCWFSQVGERDRNYKTEIITRSLCPRVLQCSDLQLTYLLGTSLTPRKEPNIWWELDVFVESTTTHYNQYFK